MNKIVDIIWKGTDMIERILEQLIEIQRKGETLEEAITILESLVNIINQTSKNKSMIIISRITVEVWKKFLLEMKEKYKIIF
jgi:hypothetical protein